MKTPPYYGLTLSTAADDNREAIRAKVKGLLESFGKKVPLALRNMTSQSLMVAIIGSSDMPETIVTQVIEFNETYMHCSYGTSERENVKELYLRRRYFELGL